MDKIKSFGIIGGDKRQLYCARSLAADGFGVILCGFDRSEDTPELPLWDLKGAISESDALILPVPVSRDGKTVFSPLSSGIIELGRCLELCGREKPVFFGVYGKAEPSVLEGYRAYCYGSRNDFAAANAVPTAEGAIMTAVSESSRCLTLSPCLVTGYGRIGRVLAHMLRGMGADVTVSARKSEDLELIRAAGMKAVNTGNITGSYDFIFNTVPALVLDGDTLRRCASGLVIDLASPPGGVDDRAAEELSVRVIHALSLPGKTAPESAGDIIKKTVYNIIREEDI